jgi:hypothetical protein
MNDRLNMPLSVGDKVIALNAYYQAVLGTIVKFTPKRVTVDVPPYGAGSYSSSNLILYTTQHDHNRVTYPELFL